MSDFTKVVKIVELALTAIEQWQTVAGEWHSLLTRIKNGEEVTSEELRTARQMSKDVVKNEWEASVQANKAKKDKKTPKRKTSDTTVTDAVRATTGSTPTSE